MAYSPLPNRHCLLLMLRILLFALTLTMIPAAAISAAPDPHSFANHDQVRVRHLTLDLDVDFGARKLRGFAELQLEWLDPSATTLVLDTRDLRIESVLVPQAEGPWQHAPYRLDKSVPMFGQALRIRLPGRPQRVRVVYQTSPAASGLQWLPPAQTAGKVHPFMFSQSQAIHARSWVPIQDAPAVRFTYDAHIRNSAGLLARMSAANDPADQPDGVDHFAMVQPIPSYLLAIAVGDLAFRPLGERSGIYAEPSVIEAAAYEFADTEKMIEVTERLYGPYRWGRYDLLVLPPSFPFGGMENPRLTFLTPTVIAGDRSLVSLIAHELAHSWSGNLVTNVDWNHFWLNEGFTSYVENRIIEAMYGPARADMERVLSQRSLELELEDLSEIDQRLVLDLRGRDPDDGMSAIAYDKGHWLLRTLETRFGREVFDPFIRGWFDRHAFGTASSDDFVAYLRSELLDKFPGKFREDELQDWLYHGGVPGGAVAASSEAFDLVDGYRRDWLDGRTEAEALPARQWSTQEWLRFLDGLPDDLTTDRMVQLDAAFALTGTGNAEIAFGWYVKAIRTGYSEVRPQLEAFLVRIGRRKFVLPLYTELAERGGADRAFAERVYARARPGYHSITQVSVDQLFAQP